MIQGTRASSGWPLRAGQVPQGFQQPLGVRIAFLPEVKHPQQMRHEVHDAQPAFGAGIADLRIQGDLQLDSQLPTDQQAANGLRLRRQPSQGAAFLPPPIAPRPAGVKGHRVLPMGSPARHGQCDRGQQQSGRSETEREFRKCAYEHTRILPRPASE